MYALKGESAWQWVRLHFKYRIWIKFIQLYSPLVQCICIKQKKKKKKKKKKKEKERETNSANNIYYTLHLNPCSHQPRPLTYAILLSVCI